MTPTPCPSTAWQQLFQSCWMNFKSRFEHILDNLERHKKLVENEASLLEIEAAQAMRAAAETQFEKLAEQEEKLERIAVTAWLDGAKSHLDQHNAKAEREAFPESGKWLLSRPQMKAWLDLSSVDKALLWIRGIPGAGIFPTCNPPIHFPVKASSLTFNML